METGDWISLISAILIGGGTLALAFMTWRSIRQTRSIQKSERRERLLNEIIEWALDSTKPKYALALASLDSTLSEQDQRVITQVAQAENTHMLIVRGNYIAKIAPVFTQNLSTAVEAVRRDLAEHSEIIDYWIKGEYSAEAIDEHNNVVGRSAKKVIEEAAKLKTQDTS